MVICASLGNNSYKLNLVEGRKFSLCDAQRWLYLNLKVRKNRTYVFCLESAWLEGTFYISGHFRVYNRSYCSIPSVGFQVSKWWTLNIGSEVRRNTQTHELREAKGIGKETGQYSWKSRENFYLIWTHSLIVRSFGEKAPVKAEQELKELEGDFIRCHTGFKKCIKDKTEKLQLRRKSW